MKTKTLKKLIKDYQLIFTNLGFKLNQEFKKDFLHIKRMKTNSTKISFIKAEKIKGLEANVEGFKLLPNDTEQREKYFTAVKPSKFLDSIIVKDNNNTLQNSLFCNIAEQFNKDFINNIKSKLVLHSGDDIGRIYNEASVVGCMSRGSKEWFKVYAKTENLQLATLSDEADTILIRSLLWYDKETKNHWLDNSYEQSAINGDNEVRKEYQKKLICQVLEHLITKDTILNFDFGCSFADCLGSSVVEEIEQKYKVKIFKDVERANENENKITLQPIIKNFDVDDFDCFPYSDSFASIGRQSGKWFINANNGDNNFICCQSQSGQDENNAGTVCDCCNERIDEDYITYSDIEEEYLCDDCAVYIEEREESCRTENATYNNYTGNYIYSGDLDR